VLGAEHTGHLSDRESEVGEGRRGVDLGLHDPARELLPQRVEPAVGLVVQTAEAGVALVEAKIRPIETKVGLLHLVADALEDLDREAAGVQERHLSSVTQDGADARPAARAARPLEVFEAAARRGQQLRCPGQDDP
jgi:hypothetical protein